MTEAQVPFVENILFSPCSLFCCLAMAARGAKGQTRQKILNLLGNMDESFEDDIKSLQRDLSERMDDSPHLSDLRFLRNRILPVIWERLPFASDGILTSAENLACDASCLEDMAKQTAEKEELSRADTWRRMHPAIRIRVLRIWLSAAAGGTMIPRLADGSAFRVIAVSPPYRT